MPGLRPAGTTIRTQRCHRGASEVPARRPPPTKHTAEHSMSDTKPVTWFDDPAHFKKASRREFLFAGLVGGLGLTLGDYMKLRAEQAALQNPLVAKAESL